MGTIGPAAININLASWRGLSKAIGALLNWPESDAAIVTYDDVTFVELQSPGAKKLVSRPTVFTLMRWPWVTPGPRGDHRPFTVQMEMERIFLKQRPPSDELATSICDESWHLSESWGSANSRRSDAGVTAAHKESSIRRAGPRRRLSALPVVGCGPLSPATLIDAPRPPDRRLGHCQRLVGGQRTTLISRMTPSGGRRFQRRISWPGGHWKWKQEAHHWRWHVCSTRGCPNQWKCSIRVHSAGAQSNCLTSFSGASPNFWSLIPMAFHLEMQRMRRPLDPNRLEISI